MAAFLTAERRVDPNVFSEGGRAPHRKRLRARRCAGTDVIAQAPLANLPSVGHKYPPADFGVLSLKAIVEVKLMRAAGQRACAEVVEQIAANAGFYLPRK